MHHAMCCYNSVKISLAFSRLKVEKNNFPGHNTQAPPPPPPQKIRPFTELIIVVHCTKIFPHF